MHNWYGIEAEAEFRRREWEREVKAAALAAQAASQNGRIVRASLPHLSLASLRSLTTAHLPFASPLAPRRRTAAC